jgi:hypothetical protein
MQERLAVCVAAALRLACAYWPYRYACARADSGIYVMRVYCPYSSASFTCNAFASLVPVHSFILGHLTLAIIVLSPVWPS